MAADGVPAWQRSLFERRTLGVRLGLDALAQVRRLREAFAPTLDRALHVLVELGRGDRRVASQQVSQRAPGDGEHEAPGEDGHARRAAGVPREQLVALKHDAIRGAGVLVINAQGA